MRQTRSSAAHRVVTFGLVGLVLAGGCGVEDPGKRGPSLKVSGTLVVHGPQPDQLVFKVYPAVGHLGAFDTSYCSEFEGEGQCYGRVRLSELGAPADVGPVTIDGNRFTIDNVPADVGYFLEITARDDVLVCSSDFLGFDDDSRVATSKSLILFEFDGDLLTYDLPRRASIICVDPTGPTTFPDPVDPEVPEDPDAIDEDGDITGPPVVDAWSSFRITNKADTEVYGDATEANVDSEVTCSATQFPDVMRVQGETGRGGGEAYIRVQYGFGAAALFQTFETRIIEGRIDQSIALTGGYSVVQLDTDPILDGVGESHTITFCRPDSDPVQQLWVQVTWDKDDTDVDIHAYSEEGREIAYYAMSADWGELDIDDIDGFGPETITSTPGVFNEGRYAIRANYFSDHGHGPTRVAGRAVYYDPVSDRVCDVTAEHTLDATGDWWEWGVFGPDDCPPAGRP